MKELSISTFKDKNFDFERVMESIIESNNTVGVLNQINELKDAVFHKKQQVLKVLKLKSNINFSEILNGFFIEHNHLNLGSLGNIESVINKYNTLKEMKICKKILTLINEIKNGFYENLSRIMKSDDLNDLFILAYVFLCFQNPKDDPQDENNLAGDKISMENLDRILTMKNEYIEKTRNSFERGQKEKNYLIMRIAYEALCILKKQDILINSFMRNLSIFNMACDGDDDNDLVFNLDFLDCNNWFFKFMDKIQEVYENELICIEGIFDRHVIQNINEKLFETVVSNAVDKLLHKKSDIEFLWYMNSAYVRVLNLYRFILTFYEFDYNVSDIFSRHLFGISKRENECINYMFSVFTGGIQTNKKYIILGEPMHFEQNERSVILKMLCFFNFFCLRSDLFKYDNDDNYFIKKHFIRRMDTYIAKNLNYSLKSFYRLNEYFFILKKVDLESKFIKDKMNEIFNTYVNNIKRDIKIIVKNHFIDDHSKNENKMIDKFIDLIKSESQKINKYVKGQNGTTLIYIIIDYMHE